jgi:hypothetical protein
MIPAVAIIELILALGNTNNEVVQVPPTDELIQFAKKFPNHRARKYWGNKPDNSG